MYKLYHQTLCPFSRKIRILLSAKNISFELLKENFWERRKEFIMMNPMGAVPVLFDGNSGDLVCPSSAIVEYIEEKHKDDNSYIGHNLINRAEARRIQAWFDEKFFPEVTKPILYEKFFNRFLPGSHSPSTAKILTSKHNLSVHLNYIEFLLENRKYLAGSQASIADFTVAAHLSCLDYFGDISWQYYNTVKQWYCLVKSHKSFTGILQDRVPNFNPPEWYSKLDY